MHLENTTYRKIQDIRLAGEHPLLQYDLLDSATLGRVLQIPELNSWGRARILRDLGMRPIGLVCVEGKSYHLWTCLPPQPRENIVALARERVRTNSIELHNEILLESGQPVPPAKLKPRLNSLELSVISLRLQHRPPRTIASTLGVHPFEVYTALQSIRRVLKMKSTKDYVELRAAVKRSRILMDDPAWQ